MKKLLPALVLSFVFTFMLFFYEPIMMYATNVDDFWFDIKIMFGPTLLYFVLFFLGSFIFFSLICLFNKFFFKKRPIYKIVIISFFIFFFITYIQGNFLAANLPALDGSTANWNKYILEDVVYIVLLIAIITSIVITIRKFGFDKVIKTSSYISLAIFFMLLTSLTTTLIKPGVFKTKDIYLASSKNLNNVSKDKNLFVLLIDAVSSKEFAKIVNNSEKYGDTFKDFTYFPDTLGAYAYTRNSIPYILSGVWYENEKEFDKYYNDAMEESKLIKVLEDNNYDINIFDNDLLWNSKKVLNVVKTNKSNSMKLDRFFQNEMRYVGFKYFPYFLKKYSFIENLNFNIAKQNSKQEFKSKDQEFYKNLIKNDYNVINNKNFSFYHVDGAHVPFNLDEEMNKVRGGTYKMKLGASLKLVNTFVNKLKENNLYDNSAIIVLADHGYGYGSPYGRQNPTLYVKGFNEHHDMYKSDKKVSYEDLQQIYEELINGKKSNELLSDIDNNRERRYLFYEYLKENFITEYYQTGNAWDLKTMKKSGKEFNR